MELHAAEICLKICMTCPKLPFLCFHLSSFLLSFVPTLLLSLCSPLFSYSFSLNSFLLLCLQHCSPPSLPLYLLCFLSFHFLSFTFPCVHYFYFHLACGLLVEALDYRSKDPGIQSQVYIFLFWVHSALPQKLSRFSFPSFGGDIKLSVPGNPLKLA